MTQEMLRNKAGSILEDNWRNGYTVPSAKLYPFQWNWDSGFIALGWMHLDPEKALQEMESLFSGQWSNGFLPHIIFHHAEKFGDQYFPSAHYWNSQVSSFAPDLVRTSGISQPPVHGFVLEQLVEKMGMNERLKRLIEQTVQLHEYYYEYRDTMNNGLLNITHNWETGMDNAPWWDEALLRISQEELENVFIDRRDQKVVKNSEDTRPSDDEYKRYIWQLNELQRAKYELIPAGYPYQMIDLAFNSIFIASGEALLRLGASSGMDLSWLKEKIARGQEHFRALLWSQEEGYFCPYDIVGQKQVTGWGAASFLPLIGGIPNEDQAAMMFAHLERVMSYQGVPSFDPDHACYHPKKYWRGPVWINMNYMIWKGLLAYGQHELATQLKQKIIGLIERYGFMEYFPISEDALTAYGGENFSWTASLILDMLETD